VQLAAIQPGTVGPGGHWSQRRAGQGSGASSDPALGVGWWRRSRKRQIFDRSQSTLKPRVLLVICARLNVVISRLMDADIASRHTDFMDDADKQDTID
jgi:hypothetical protein